MCGGHVVRVDVGDVLRRRPQPRAKPGRRVRGQTLFQVLQGGFERSHHAQLQPTTRVTSPSRRAYPYRPPTDPVRSRTDHRSRQAYTSVVWIPLARSRRRVLLYLRMPDDGSPVPGGHAKETRCDRQILASMVREDRSWVRVEV